MCDSFNAKEKRGAECSQGTSSGGTTSASKKYRNPSAATTSRTLITHLIFVNLMQGPDYSAEKRAARVQGPHAACRNVPRCAVGVTRGGPSCLRLSVVQRDGRSQGEECVVDRGGGFLRGRRFPIDGPTGRGPHDEQGFMKRKPKCTSVDCIECEFDDREALQPAT